MNLYDVEARHYHLFWPLGFSTNCDCCCSGLVDYFLVITHYIFYYLKASKWIYMIILEEDISFFFGKLEDIAEDLHFLILIFIFIICCWSNENYYFTEKVILFLLFLWKIIHYLEFWIFSAINVATNSQLQSPRPRVVRARALHSLCHMDYVC